MAQRLKHLPARRETRVQSLGRLFKFWKYVFFHGDWLHLPIIQGHSFSQFPFMIKTATFHFLYLFGRKHISESSDPSFHCIVKLFFLGCILNIHTPKDYNFSSIHCLGFNSILFTGGEDFSLSFKLSNDFHCNYTLPEGIPVYVPFTILTRRLL